MSSLLLWCLMPGHSGWGACCSCTCRAQLHALPLLAGSAAASPGTAVRCTSLQGLRAPGHFRCSAQERPNALACWRQVKRQCLSPSSTTCTHYHGLRNAPACPACQACSRSPSKAALAVQGKYGPAAACLHVSLAGSQSSGCSQVFQQAALIWLTRPTGRGKADQAVWQGIVSLCHAVLHPRQQLHHARRHDARIQAAVER